jgi:phosphoserine phosphatase
MIKLIAFDLDGVILDQEVSWREIHKALGTYDEDALEKLRQEHLAGKISYKEWGDRELSVWKEIPYAKAAKVVSKLKFIPGAKETISELKKRGYKLAIISSGGLLNVLEPTLKKMGFDYVYMNDAEEANGIMTGNIIANVPHNEKREVLSQIAKKEQISLEHCAVVGDSINDRSMFRAAGFSIAFCSGDEMLKRAAKVIVDKKDLREVLPYFQAFS